MTSINPISTPNLKPERIGLTAALPAASPLKPERIGLRLQKLPGWELVTAAETQAIWRGFRFHRTETAQAFAAYVGHIAAEHGERPVIAQSWNEVTVTVPGEGSLTDRVFDFAELLMLLPQTGSSQNGPATELPSLPEAQPSVAQPSVARAA